MERPVTSNGSDAHSIGPYFRMSASGRVAPDSTSTNDARRPVMSLDISRLSRPAQDQPGIDGEVDDNDGGSQHPLKLARQASGIDDGEQVVFKIGEGADAPRQPTSSLPSPDAIVISPISAASSKPCCRKISSTASTASGAHDTSRPPLVCGSLSSA